MTFGTLCSGIEGAAVAFRDFGWRHAYSAEVDSFCCKLLAHHYPGVPNLGDITTATPPPVDLIVAGTPCQSFSVAGRRGGLDDPRGRLALRFVEILAATRPRWVVWENVPGVLSSGQGADFATFIDAITEVGYGVAWRILDARYFGVAQRRRRVFVVGHLGNVERAADVLFDADPCGEDARQIGEARRPSHAAGEGARQLLGWSGDTTPKFSVDVCPTLRASQGGEGVGIIEGDLFRRLTVDEWERLQGFPVGYTAIPGRGQTARTKAIGNSFAVPVMRWVGERLAFADETTLATAA